jgi:hypothetical protein
MAPADSAWYDRSKRGKYRRRTDVRSANRQNANGPYREKSRNDWVQTKRPPVGGLFVAADAEIPQYFATIGAPQR